MSQVAEFLPVKNWAHLSMIWWLPDKSLHLFKPSQSGQNLSVLVQASIAAGTALLSFWVKMWRSLL